MVRGNSFTLVREWNGPWRKNEKATKNYLIYNPGILILLTIQFGVEFLSDWLTAGMTDTIKLT